VTDVPPAGVEAAFELAVYYSEMIADRRINPGDDLVSALCQVKTDGDAVTDGDRLTDDEITSFLFLMVVAGNETTTKLLAHAWYWAWANPDERAKVFADPGRIPDWVEETLRYDTSSQMLARVTTHRRHPARHDDPRPGDRVLLLAGSANRDHRQFPDPDRFDLDRDTTGIASFGVGAPLLHGCLPGTVGNPGGARGAGQAGRVLRDRCRGCQAGALGERPRGSPPCPPLLRSRDDARVGFHRLFRCD
jgi:cytochrome P450